MVGEGDEGREMREGMESEKDRELDSTHSGMIRRTVWNQF